MWLAFAFLSALLLGFYDVFKKQSLDGNAVLPVLLLNTLFSSLIFLPFILLSAWMPEQMAAHPLIYVPAAGWEVHRLILLKSLIVLSSWMLGYFGLKHLPITIVGPINATRPVMVLVGAMLIFGERLNLWQWIGVILAAVSFLMLSRSGRKEGIDFKHNRWIFCIVLAALLGAVSGLYDKFLMRRLDPMLVQSWYNLYQLGIMSVVVAASCLIPIPLALEYSADLDLPVGSRLRLFLCAEPRRFDDFGRIDGAAGQRHRLLRIRSDAVPRKKSAQQSGRPGAGVDRHALPLLGIEIARGCLFPVSGFISHSHTPPV